MQTESILYSVIIPHYNSPKLLERCLASIPIREDIQVIIVDDCSSPDKADFAHLPGRERLNTEIYQTRQGGSAGRARNVGIEHAKGKWLLFADADDYFEQGAWSIIDEYKNDKADIVFFGTTSRISDTGEPANRQTHFMKLLHQYDPDNKETEELLKFCYYAPWSKLIRREIVEKHHVQFEEIRYANDVMFSMYTSLYATTIAVDIRPVYCITEVYGSLTNIMSESSMTMRYEVYLRRNQLLRQNGYRQYQISTLFYLRKGLKQYGLKTFFNLLLLALKYKNNPLIGIGDVILHPIKHIRAKEDSSYAKYEIHA